MDLIEIAMIHSGLIGDEKENSAEIVSCEQAMPKRHEIGKVIHTHRHTHTESSIICDDVFGINFKRYALCVCVCGGGVIWFHHFHFTSLFPQLDVQLT